MEIELKDKVLKLSVSSVHATILWHFQQKGEPVLHCTTSSRGRSCLSNAFSSSEIWTPSPLVALVTLDRTPSSR